MEGVKRITIFVNEEKLCRIRAPYLFRDLQKTLVHFNLGHHDEIVVELNTGKKTISNDKSYEKLINMSGFQGLKIKVNKAISKPQPAKSPEKKANLPKKRQNTSQSFQKPRKSSKYDSKVKNYKHQNKKSDHAHTNTRSNSSNPQTFAKLISQSNPQLNKSESSKQRSKTLTPSKPSFSNSTPNSKPKQVPRQSPRLSPNKPSSTIANLSPKPSPVKQNTQSPLSKSNLARSKISNANLSPLNVNSPTNANKSPINLAARSSNTDFLNRNLPQRTLNSSSVNDLLQSGSGTITLDLGPDRNSNLFSMQNLPLFQIPTFSNNIDILNSFSNIFDEGNLKVTSGDGKHYKNITEFSIKKSSRLLLTPEGIMITGGSGAPYQVFIIKNDFTVVPLVSMNHPRFWHCMGYIDGYPAVINGAEKSKNPKIFLNTVEVYKDGAWVDYPCTNYERASTSVTWMDKQVFVVGGVTTTGYSNTIVNFIEKFQDGIWAVVKLNSMSYLISPGVFNIDDKKIIVFGGEVSGTVYKSDVTAFDLETGEIMWKKELKKASKFTYGQQSKYSEGVLTVCDCFGNLMKIEID